ncbi:uncharacterized protein N0V89_001054 [Didymosphaeria variabile]|uniref:Uncharacterized protein n=1 Tax=Didymosphaeria variabile TaxID=1932322 RepID=A0A9W8XVH6_9PLEO|nr:uncharacterized protein N0V89_001054 [Didymosphaeria variabile]KAJ4360489.1 hypothetical protein N0V89_001054 [Didymosphaeria variabile]
MPGSLARKERRRKEREDNHTPRAIKPAYVESIDDEGETDGGAVQAAEEIRPEGDEDIPSLVPLCEPQKYSQSSPRRAANPLQTFARQEPLDKSKTFPKQPKSRSKRGPPPQIPRESEPPFGSLGSLHNYPTSIYEEALNTLRNMTPEDSVRLRNVVISQMAAEGFPLPVDAQPEEIPAVTYPIRSITNPPWAPSTRGRDIMTDTEAENLRFALFDKIKKSQEQVNWAAPTAKALKDPKSAESPVLQALGGNVDGASHSVDIVTPEGEATFGEHASIVHSRDSEEQANVNHKLQAPLSADLITVPSIPNGQEVLGDGVSISNAEHVERIRHMPAQEQISEASAALEKTTPMAESNDHTDRVARIDGMTEKLRQSVEEARAEICPPRKCVTLDRGFAQRSSSSDYASSSGDSGSKPYVSRTRRITSDGILELKASPLKVDGVRIPTKEHRRKVSLKLPINVSNLQRAYAHPFARHTHSASVSTDEGVLPLYEAEERDLEYKHRHIFIGTASLDDFLEILEITPAYTTTKRKVVKAFAALVCAEQVQARQSSITSDGWNFVTRTTPENTLTHIDYLTESHVKLGSITLGKFLDKIPFDDENGIAAIKVVEAFCLASHLDGEATYGSQSKAKAFRSWYVRENAAKEDT